MNRALIFAGGKGVRMQMNGNVPKQFLTIRNKSIIIHTLEKFELCNDIDDIIVVCIEDWIDELKKQIQSFKFKKISNILQGGETGFDSRYIGLEYIFRTRETDNDIVLIHDGVRPFINNELIKQNIYLTEETGNAITVAKATETIIFKCGEVRDKILERENCILARAPQTFKIAKIFSYYDKAKKQKKTDIIDSASLAYYYGENLNFVEGPQENIKITTPIDFFAAQGLISLFDNKKN